MHENPPRRPGRWTAAGLVCLLAALLRSAVILAPPDDLYPDPGGKVHTEELLRGMAAVDILEGPLLELFDYQLNDFSGGSLVVSLLAVPGIALVGPTVPALRFTALLFGVLAVLLVFLILELFVSRRAAWIGALLLACAPPGYALNGATVYGTHMEANTLALLLVLLFLGRHLAGWRRPWHTFLLGAAAGFAVYFSYGLLLVLGILLVFELAYDKRFLLRRDALFGAAGFAAGLAPWILYQLDRRGAGLLIYGRGVADHLPDGESGGLLVRAVRLVLRAVRLVATDLPEALYFPPSAGGLATGRAVALVLAALWATALCVSIARFLLALARPGADPAKVHPAVLFLAQPPLLLVAMLATDFGVDNRRDWVLSFRYFMPALPFLFLSAAVALDAAPRALAAGVTALLCAISVAGVLLHCRPSMSAENWRTPAYDHRSFARYIALKHDGEIERLAPVVEGILERREPAVREEMLAAMGKTYRFLAGGVGLAPRHQRRVEEYRRALAWLRERVPEPYKAHFEPPAGR